MSQPDQMVSYRGECSCGWQGPRRPASTDAHDDTRVHCRETGCVNSDDVGVHPSAPVDIDLESLMPHERRKLGL